MYFDTDGIEIERWQRRLITGSVDRATFWGCDTFTNTSRRSCAIFSALSCFRLQTELARGFSSTSNIQLERATSLLLEQDPLASSLSNGNQRLSEVDQELHSIKGEKRALFVTARLQASGLKTFRAKKRVTTIF